MIQINKKCNIYYLKNYDSNDKKLTRVKQKICNILERELTEYESTYIKSWIYNYNISEDDIIIIFNHSKIVNFNEINKKLLGLDF